MAKQSAAGDAARREFGWDSPSAKRLLIMGTGPGLVLLPVLLICVSDRVCQQCPVWLQHHALRIAWFVGLPSILFAMACFAAILLVTGNPQRQFVLRAVVMLTFVLLAAAWKSNAGVESLLRQRETQDGIVLQSTPYTCVSASLANVARISGRDFDERDAARLLHTTRRGTRWGSTRFALTRLSIPHRDLNGRFESLRDVPAPAILWVDHPRGGRESHALLYRQRLDEKFELWEPMGGRLILSEAEVQEFWHGNGIACTIIIPGALSANRCRRISVADEFGNTAFQSDMTASRSVTASQQTTTGTCEVLVQ